MRISVGLPGMMLLAIGVRAVAQPTPVIDNERVTVRDVTLAKGMEGPATPHDLDIRFNKRDRTHYEELTTGRQSAVMAELK